MKIKSNIRDYDVVFAGAADFLREFAGLPHVCYVVDSSVWELYPEIREAAGPDAIELPIGEERKNLDTVQELYDRLTGRAAKRNMTLISIGGGITQDVTGFVASTLYRGINWVFVPTTLLAQADSCVGSKTSLNYKGYKNLVGTFYPPSKVCIDTAFIATQEEPDFFSGLGEVVKLHLMGGEPRTAELIGLLPPILRREREALLTGVKNSLEIKQSYIADDEFDTGRRNLLNFGHCFGHALESTSDFGVPHGQAVVAGMVLANAVAARRGLLSDGLEKFVAERLLLPSLVVQPEQAHLDHGQVVEAMKKDKKRTGDGLALIMMGDGYEFVKVNDLTAAEAAFALDQFSRLLERVAA